MKVFNKKVNHCKQCPCYSSEELASGAFGWCNVVEEHVSQEIPKDCPFNKPVTKEDFEKFGFKELSHSNIHLLKFKQGDFFTMYSPYNNHCIIEKGIINEMSTLPESLLMFKGTINNPIELEFILKSIGVIE
jgi:hypothetical protein